MAEKDKAYDKVNNLDKETARLLIDGQKEFFDFYREIKGEEYPAYDVHFIKKLDEVNILHLNTAWLCGGDNEEGNIYIGTNKLLETLRSVRFETGDLNIAIGHHSLDCFNKEQENHLRRYFKEFDIDFYLSGHRHEPLIYNDADIGTYHCVCRQMRYDDFASGGVVVGNIDVNSSHYLQFYFWNKKGYWTHEIDIGVHAPNGFYTVNLGKFPLQKKSNSVVLINKTLHTPVNQEQLIKDVGLDADSQVFDYEFHNLDIFTPEEWLYHKNQTKEFISSVYPELKEKSVHIFPLSQIPLLIYMGYLLGNDNNNISIYQFDDHHGNWVLDYGEFDIRILPFQYKKRKSKSLAVALEISSIIKDEDINEVIDTKKNSLLRISIKEPKRNQILYERQVKEFKEAFRSGMEDYLPYYDEIHLFYAGPAGLAVEIGRCIQKNMYPRVYLYNFRRTNSPKYQFAFAINDF